MVYIGTTNFMQKKPVWIGLNRHHGPQKTGPRWFGSVPSISGLVLDRLQSTVAHFGGKKPDWTGPANTTICTTKFRECVCMCWPVTSTNWEVTGHWPYCAITWPVKPMCQDSRPSSPSTITTLHLDSLCRYAFVYLTASTAPIFGGPSLRNIQDVLRTHNSKLHFCGAFFHSVHHNVLSNILWISR